MPKKTGKASGIDIKDHAAWQKFVGAHLKGEQARDPLGTGVVRLAYDWARAMEEEISAGRELEDIAWDAFLKADTQGVTGGMAKAATHNLGLAWKHGDRLVAWHNREAEKPGTAPYLVGKIDL